eukprot:12461174-Alexandrium_andersonii.AAC.1
MRGEVRARHMLEEGGVHAVGVAPPGDLVHEEHPLLPPGLRRLPRNLKDNAMEVADDGRGQLLALE